MDCGFSDGDVARIVAPFSFVPFLLGDKRKRKNKIIFFILQSFLDPITSISRIFLINEVVKTNCYLTIRSNINNKEVFQQKKLSRKSQITRQIDPEEVSFQDAIRLNIVICES